MNGQEIVNYIEFLLGDASGNYWPRAMLTIFMQRSFLSVFTEVMQANRGYFLVSSNISLVANQEMYDLPTGWSKVDLVERLYGNRYVNLYPCDIVEKNVLASNPNMSVPAAERYFIAGNQIGFSPIPSSAVANAIRVWTVAVPTLPADLTTGAGILPAALTDMHHEVIAWGGFMRAIVRDKQLLAQVAPMYQEMKALLKADVQSRQTQSPPTVIDADPEEY